MNRLIILATLILNLIGCSTGYQKLGLTGGYNDIQLSSDIYLVKYSSNAFTNYFTNYSHALRRCAEIAVKNGYKYFLVIKNIDDTKSYHTPVVASSNTHTQGYMDSSLIGSSINSRYHSNSSGTTIISGGEIRNKPEIILKIKLLHKPSNGSLNAYTILRNLKTQK